MHTITHNFFGHAQLFWLCTPLRTSFLVTHTKELLTLHSGCHANLLLQQQSKLLVHIAYAHPYAQRFWLCTLSRTTFLVTHTIMHSFLVMYTIMHICLVTRTVTHNFLCAYAHCYAQFSLVLHTITHNVFLVMHTKKLLRLHSGCHGNLVAVAIK